MTYELGIITFICLVALYFVFIKTHIAYAILALSAGFLLKEFLAQDLTAILSGLSSYTYFESIKNIVLLILPPLIISLHFKNTQNGFKRGLQQLVPALSWSLLLTILVFNELPVDVKQNILDNSYIIRNLLAFKSLLVAFSFAVAFFDIINSD